MTIATKTVATVTAAALALSMAATTPARASDKGAIALGLGGFIIGKAVSDNRQKQQASRNQYSTNRVGKGSSKSFQNGYDVDRDDRYGRSRYRN